MTTEWSTSLKSFNLTFGRVEMACYRPGPKDVGEWKSHAVQAFKSILHLTVRNSLKTQSPIPDWAAAKIKESWNVQER
jgi:hypothetical protein